MSDGSRTDTGQNIWADFGEAVHHFSLSGICGSAKLCNSAIVYRAIKPAPLTPDDIPVDVTEHFREQMFAAGIALHSKPMVNYAVTLKTARGRGGVWGNYQSPLIASVFAALPHARSRRELALTLWAECPSPTAPRTVALVMCGLAMREARDLLTTAPKVALLPAAINILRRPGAAWRGRRSQHGLDPHFAFLRDAPLTQELADGVNKAGLLR